MRKALMPLISVLVGLVFLIPLAIGLMQGRVIEIELAKPKTAKEALQQAYTKHFQEKDYQGAIEKYRWIVENFPGSEEAVEAQYRIGNIYQWDLVESEEAIREYEKLRERYPESEYAIAALIRIGECYGRMKEYEREIKYCKQVIEKYPDSDFVAEAKAVMAGTLLHELGKFDEARDVYEDILTNHPNSDFSDDAKLWLVFISHWKHEISTREAMKKYEALLNDESLSHKARAGAQYMIGYSYYIQGEWDKAIESFRKVLIRFPNIDYDAKAETLYFIGFLYEKRGDLLKAKEKFREVIERYPKSIWVNRARSRIERVERKLIKLSKKEE